VLDFTSALYLGFDHAWSDLPGWDRLTLGKPAALVSPPGAPAVERELAALVGCERALLAPSTLHVFGDLFTILAGREVNYFLDDGTYPVARWGAERAVAVGRPVRFFPRHDARALREAIARADRKPPVVVADGFCLACGSSAPIDAYLKCTAHLNGLVVVDDTQALGILGRNPTPLAPFGRGGGGRLLRQLHHFQRAGPVGQAAQEAAFLKGGDQPVDPRFRGEIQGLLHLVERGRDAGFLDPLMDEHEQFMLLAGKHDGDTLRQGASRTKR